MPARRSTTTTLILIALVAGIGAARAQQDHASIKRFLLAAEQQLLELSIQQQRAAWVKSTFITPDTEKIEAEKLEQLISLQMKLAAEAAKYPKTGLPYDLARKLELLRTSIVLPAPSDPALASELTEIATRMEGLYGAGQYCRDPAEPSSCLDLDGLSRILATSRDPQVLVDAWRGWRTISPPIRPLYRRFVELANAGAKDLGFNDTGALWRSKYDLPPEAFSAELDRLWSQVRPLYESLHCFVRSRLQARYGKQLVPDGQPIPAHLLGNMWAQQWGNIYPLVAPSGDARGFDLTQLLRAKQVDPKELVRYGERFFTSVGFDPLPETFWERSMFSKPADREVVCHASAWDIDFDRDVRIKMCIDVGEEDFVTVHHELGHNYYQMAYREQPFIYRDSANDGFHEGIGDTLALSVTPEYLVSIGLLDKLPDSSGDIGLLLNTALDKVAFLPFGLLIDKWRWGVFSGEIPAEKYNQAWWDLVRKYQGVVPPVARSEQDFDPGAKYHVPANTPYARYFLAHILQFQFHRSLCKTAGNTSPLHRCSIYGNKQAGEKLANMLEMGLSRPWPDALEAVTGQREMDASAVLEYFAPLKRWLDAENKKAGARCGW
jgi:peptidyl-dipeptidase A